MASETLKRKADAMAATDHPSATDSTATSSAAGTSQLATIDGKAAASCTTSGASESCKKTLPTAAAAFCRVRVKTMSGDVFPVDVTASETVASLKRKIRAHNPRLEVAWQRLAIMRKALLNGSASCDFESHQVDDHETASADFEVLDNDARTLTSYGVTNDAAIELMIDEPTPFGAVRSATFRGDVKFVKSV